MGQKIRFQVTSFFTIILILSCPTAKSQIVRTEDDLIRYESKIHTVNFISTLLNYPFESLQNKEIGIIIGGIYLNTDSIFIANSVSPTLDAGFRNALKITLANYRQDLENIATDNKVILYDIIKIEQNDYEISYKNIPKSFIGPIRQIVSGNIYMTQTKVSKNLTPNSATGGRILAPPQTITSTKINEIDPEPDVFYTTKIKVLLEKEKYKKSLKYFEELIHRNPFNPELFIQRAEIYQKLGETEKAKKDYRFIIDFVDNSEFVKIAQSLLFE